MGELSISNLKKSINKSKNVELGRFILFNWHKTYWAENAKILAAFSKKLKILLILQMIKKG